MNWIVDWVQPGTWAVDVGANEGTVTRHLLAAGAAVIAIEPHAEVIETLRQRCPTATVLHAAATDHEGVVPYHYSRQSPHGSLYRANVVEDIDRMELVTAVTLDRVCPHARAIKVDAQGAEAAILRGAQRILAQHAAVWYVELWQTGLRAAGESVAAVRALFDAHGYAPRDGWDAMQAAAEACGGHSAIDVLVLPPGRN